MTTLAMGAGMMPIALGLGAADGSFRSPDGGGGDWQADHLHL